MSRKTKASLPKDREAVMLQVRQILAEHFAHGICEVAIFRPVKSKKQGNSGQQRCK